MLLRCHETACQGSRETAGIDPEGGCQYCGQPLADEYGTIVVSDGTAASFAICQWFGHLWEGRMIAGPPERLEGSCARCGQEACV